jgi:tetratricopeptide (TPR) repeat protein
MYSQAIAGAEGDATLFGNRSAAYLAAGLYQEAILDAQKATAINPAWAKGFYRHAAYLNAADNGMETCKNEHTPLQGLRVPSNVVTLHSQ